MTVLGLPLSMFLVFVATLVAGSLGAIHYTIVHIIGKRPFGDEDLRRRRLEGLGKRRPDGAGPRNGPGGDR